MSKVYDTLDTDRATGVHPRCGTCLQQGRRPGRVVWNIAQDGCVVKRPEWTKASGISAVRPRCSISQEDACEGILNGSVVSGDVVVITHEGPKGGPGYAGDALSDILSAKAATFGEKSVP